MTYLNKNFLKLIKCILQYINWNLKIYKKKIGKYKQKKVKKLLKILEQLKENHINQKNKHKLIKLMI